VPVADALSDIGDAGVHEARNACIGEAASARAIAATPALDEKTGAGPDCCSSTKAPLSSDRLELLLAAPLDEQ
jgi:hypothetical protein